MLIFNSHFIGSTAVVMVVLPQLNDGSGSDTCPSDVRNAVSCPNVKPSLTSGGPDPGASLSTDVTSRHPEPTGSDENPSAISKPTLVKRYSSGTLSSTYHSASDPGLGQGCRVVIGHVGDCRAVLCDGGVGVSCHFLL
jgi:serine/threonine protein phosphatase PrpC